MKIKVGDVIFVKFGDGYEYVAICDKYDVLFKRNHYTKLWQNGYEIIDNFWSTYITIDGFYENNEDEDEVVLFKILSEKEASKYLAKAL